MAPGGGSELSPWLGTCQSTGLRASQGLRGAGENLPLNGNSLACCISLGWSPSEGGKAAVFLVAGCANQVVQLGVSSLPGPACIKVYHVLKFPRALVQIQILTQSTWDGAWDLLVLTSSQVTLRLAGLWTTF